MAWLMSLVIIVAYCFSFYLGYITGINEPCLRDHVPDDEAF